MKPLLVAALLSLALPAAALASDDSLNLANGYAQAVQASGRTTVCLVYETSAGHTETIKNVNDIKSFGGVLLVKAYGGSRQILDASRVIKITDS